MNRGRGRGWRPGGHQNSGFLANEDKLKDYADDDDPRWAAFVTAWFGQFGAKEVTSAQLMFLGDEHLDLGGDYGKSKSTRWGQMSSATPSWPGTRSAPAGRDRTPLWRLEPVNVE